MDRQFILNKIRYWEGQLHLAQRVPNNWEDQSPVQRFYKSYYNPSGHRMRNPNSRRRYNNG